jgi:hypothetical protein
VIYDQELKRFHDWLHVKGKHPGGRADTELDR